MENKVKVALQIADQSLTPKYASLDAAGADICAAIYSSITIAPGKSKLIPTSLKVMIPKGYEIQIRPRSGLALKHQITVLNSPGTIDADYRGEIGVILINHGREDFVVEPKMRIAQLVIAPVIQADFYQCSDEEFTLTARGEGGFGHTGSH